MEYMEYMEYMVNMVNMVNMGTLYHQNGKLLFGCQVG